jgi:hypothetical protein
MLAIALAFYWPSPWLSVALNSRLAPFSSYHCGG